MGLKLIDIIDKLEFAPDNYEKDKNFDSGTVDGNLVEIVVKGTKVSGQIIKRESQILGVSISSPYSGVCGWSGHVPIFALPRRSLKGPYGDYRAKTILSNIYEFCCFAEAHKQELKVCLKKYYKKLRYLKEKDKRRQQLYIELEELRQQRRVLRRALKAGEMNNIAYQKQVMPINAQIHKLRYETRIDYSAVFKASFGHFWNSPLFNVHPTETIEFINWLENNTVQESGTTE